MKKRILKMSAITLAGALVGFLYYYFIGCSSGTCAITSNPYLTTGFGAAAGLIISI